MITLRLSCMCGVPQFEPVYTHYIMNDIFPARGPFKPRSHRVCGPRQFFQISNTFFVIFL